MSPRALVAPPDVVRARLPELGAPPDQPAVLAWLLAQGGAAATAATAAEVQAACGLRSDSAIRSLKSGRGGGGAATSRPPALDNAAATELLLTLRGANKYRPILDALASAAHPLWKHELAALTAAPLPLLRDPTPA